MEPKVTYDDLSDRGEIIKIGRPRELESVPITQKTSIINVPHTEVIPTKLTPGRVIYIVGTVKPKADRFAINLTCGIQHDADIAFHLNPRLAIGHVIRNSHIGNRWGDEEIVAYHKNPFHIGKLFYLLILAAEDCFMISVNGAHFCSFTYRTNINLVNTLKIEGDVTLRSIEYRQVDSYPEPCPLKLNVFETVNSLSKIKDRPFDLPLILQLPKAFTFGQEINISGKMKLLPMAFYINLQSGSQVWPHAQISLHVNPRFLASGGTSVIRNSWLCGEWGEEEADTVYHFRAGRSFTINIKCEEDAYVLNVDECFVARFSHRVHPELANTIYVQGDIFLHDLTIVS